MTAAYPQRAPAALLMCGALSAATALLASGLVFHMSSVSAEANGAVPWWAGRVLHPLATVLATLCLLLNVSCCLLCLLHAYFSTELHGGLPGAERADLFLLDSRKVRHAAIGLFCCGITFYLTAFTFYMLLEFRIGPGIAGACILSAGIIVLFLVVTLTLLQVSRRSQQSPSKATHNLYENDSAPHGESSGSHGGAAPRPRPEIHRAFSFPVFLEHNSQLSSSGSPGPRGDRDSPELPRRHRTLSAESALLRAQLKPWNVVTQEMRNVMSLKAGAKDATLV